MSYEDPSRRPREPRPPHPSDPQRPYPPEPQRPAAYGDEGRVPALEERLRSLRGILIAVAVLAAIALAIAFWALLSGGSAGDGTRASDRGSSSALRSRVNKLENRIGDRATKGDVSDVSDQVKKLGSQVDAASSAAKGSDQSDAISDLKGQVKDLQDSVQQLQDQGSGSATTPTTP